MTFYPRFWLWYMIPSVWFLILSLDLLIPDFKNFDAMERHLGSTLYSGLVKGVSASYGHHSKIRMMIYRERTVWYIRCSLLRRHSSFSTLLGREDYLTNPKNVCWRLRQKFEPFLFLKQSNHHSDLKMVTSPRPSSLRSRLHVSTKGASWNSVKTW